MGSQRIRDLRSNLGLSRSELARFLGVSEATVVRWEAEEGVTEPKGLQAVLLRTLTQASRQSQPRDVARIVRSCGIDHARALHTLLGVAQTQPASVAPRADVA